jgi:hypothetical protein
MAPMTVIMDPQTVLEVFFCPRGAFVRKNDARGH